jgi:hypothetical protein
MNYEWKLRDSGEWRNSISLHSSFSGKDKKMVGKTAALREILPIEICSVSGARGRFGQKL